MEISPTLISNVTNKIMEEVTQWKARAIDELYPIIFFGPIYYKVREKAKIINKAANVTPRINKTGHKEVMGIYIGENVYRLFGCRF